MKATLFLLLATLMISACSQQEPAQVERLSGRTMGTSYSIVWPSQSTSAKPAKIQPLIQQRLLELNRQMSTYDTASEISQFNQAASPYQQAISPAFAEVMALAIELHKLSDGFFDVSVGPLVNLWGFGPNTGSKAPNKQQLDAALHRVGLSEVTLNSRELKKHAQRYIDLSAIAKGYAVDELALILDQYDIKAYLVEVGGEIRTKGQKAQGKPWKVAIESPDISQRRVHKILAMDDNAMATSGDYRNYFEVDGQHFSHSINPFNGKPVQHKLASVTVIHQNCARADALATAMLVMGEVKAKVFAREHGIKAYLIERQGTEFKEYLSPAFSSWLIDR